MVMMIMMVTMTKTTMMRPVEGAAALVGAGEVKRVGGKRADELVLVMIVILLIMMEMCSYHNNCEYHHECDIKDYFETCDTSVKRRPAKNGGFDWVPHLECFETTVRGLPSLEWVENIHWR